MPKCEIESVELLSKKNANPVIGKTPSSHVFHVNSSPFSLFSVNFQNATPLEEDNEVRYVVDKDKKPGLLLQYNGNLNTKYYGLIGDKNPSDLVSTYLAIRNKETNKVRIVEVERCSVLSEHYVEPQQESDTRAIDVRSLLYKNFGSKSAARAMDKKEKTEFNVDILKDKLDTSVFDVDESVLMDESTVAGDDEIRPVRNKEATKVEDLYKVDEIIPKKILANLEKPASTLLETKPIHLPFTLPFVLGIVKEVQMSKEPDSAENMQKLKICIYLDALGNVLNSKSKIMSKIEISKMSNVLSKHIKEAFTNDTRHE